MPFPRLTSIILKTINLQTILYRHSEQDKSSKLGPEAAVLGIGEMVAWIKSKFREPPKRLPVTSPGEEKVKWAAVVRRPFVSELSEHEVTNQRVHDWINEEYRRATRVPTETHPPPAHPGEVIGNQQVPQPGKAVTGAGEVIVTAESGIQEELYESSSCGKRVLWRHGGGHWRLVPFGVVWVASFLATTLLAWFFVRILLGPHFLDGLEHAHSVFYGLFGLSVLGVSWWVARTFWDELEPQLDAWGERRERRRKLSLEEVLYPRLDKPKIEPKAPGRRKEKT